MAGKERQRVLSNPSREARGQTGTSEVRCPLPIPLLFLHEHRLRARRDRPAAIGRPWQVLDASSEKASWPAIRLRVASIASQEGPDTKRRPIAEAIQPGIHEEHGRARTAWASSHRDQKGLPPHPTCPRSPPKGAKRGFRKDDRNSSSGRPNTKTRRGRSGRRTPATLFQPSGGLAAERRAKGGRRQSIRGDKPDLRFSRDHHSRRSRRPRCTLGARQQAAAEAK